MQQISETYASPNLRWGLLLEDWPTAIYDSEYKSGKELGIPTKFGGDQDFCVITIHFPASSGKASVTAWKPSPSKGNADDWNILCTKTLGRALKKAGFPDDMKDLKALVLWRQRNTEIEAISSGTTLAIGPGKTETVEVALEQAATTKEEAIQDKDELISENLDAEEVLAEVVDIGVVDRLTQVRNELGSMTDADKANFREFLKLNEMSDKSAAWSGEDLTSIEEWLLSGEED